MFTAVNQIWAPLPLIVMGGATVIAFVLVFLNARRNKK